MVLIFWPQLKQSDAVGFSRVLRGMDLGIRAGELCLMENELCCRALLLRVLLVLLPALCNLNYRKYTRNP